MKNEDYFKYVYLATVQSKSLNGNWPLSSTASELMQASMTVVSMTIMYSVQLQLRLSWHLHRRRHEQKLTLSPRCALTKQTHRFLTSLAAAAINEDPSTANRLITKFVASSPKTIALNALSHLLSPTTTHPRLSLLALPLYTRITEASWFLWNGKLIAELIALLEKQERFEEAQALISETVSKLESRERDLAQFYCNLIDSHSKHKSKQSVFDSYASLTQLVSNSSSVYLKRRAYEAMINALCVMDLPQEAEMLIEEMRRKRIKPSVFEMRSVLYGYGRLGLFNDMQRSIDSMEKEGFEVDTICSNMILSSYGAHSELTEMVSWLRRMKSSGIPFSIRTYNSVLNSSSCPTIMSLLQEPKDFPLSIEKLETVLDLHDGDEAQVVRELVDSAVLDEAMEWSVAEAKLDLHGMHLGTAYLIMLQWMEELASRFRTGDYVIPAEITVVCGSGKHSSVRGESPVKSMVKEMMVRTGSAMRIDRKNTGCFVAKGRVVKDWLC